MFRVLPMATRLTLGKSARQPIRFTFIHNQSWHPKLQNPKIQSPPVTSGAPPLFKYRGIHKSGAIRPEIQHRNSGTKSAPSFPQARGILSVLPASWVPYAELSRIEKPGGLYGFYMAYLIGLGYSASIVTPAPTLAALTIIAGKLLIYNVFLRGAACTVNDILDRDYDRQVARCKNRPVARGAVTPSQAYVWYGVQTLGAGAVIACLPSPLTALAYAIPIQLVVSLYPLCKRYMDFPQLVLSAPIAGGILMAAATLGLDLSSASPQLIGATASLFFSHYIWTTIFDYVNACQDTTDDIKAGVRSMAVRYQNTNAFISILGAAQVGSLAITCVLAGLSPITFIGVVGGNAAWIVAMVRTVKRSRPDICGWWFAWGGLLVSGTTSLALFAEYLNRPQDTEASQVSLNAALE